MPPSGATRRQGSPHRENWADLWPVLPVGAGTAPRSGASGANLSERKRGRAPERHLLGWGQCRDLNHPGVRRYATPPASGGLCRAPPGELPGGRRSLTGGTIWMVAYL